MPINVLFFGATADIVGKREIELACANPTSVEDVFALLSGEFPILRAHRLLFAVNQEYVGDKQMLENGDELAVFTAVSGG